MDPITTTILAALGVMGSEAIKSGVKDAYDNLKAVIRCKWGETAPISKAIGEEPTSKPQAVSSKRRSLPPGQPHTYAGRALALRGLPLSLAAELS
jgi:hypothetical protein